MIEVGSYFLHGERRVMKTRWFTPWLCILPAVILVTIFLAYPTVRTIQLSFYDRQGRNFVGLNNYWYIFRHKSTLLAIRNNLLWMTVFPSISVILGLIVAILADRVSYEKVIKGIVFMPMAISFVGAGVIWKFVYAYKPKEVSQIGLLNAIVVACGGQPIAWLSQRPWINNLCLIIIGIWIWTGFCVVIFSAAYRNISKEIIEAARIDGANEWQAFWRVILPQLKPTIAAVMTTLMVFALKVFDIVYVTTNGLFDTEVLVNRMYKEMFLYHNVGRACAIAVVLFIASVLILGYNIRSRFVRKGG